MKKSKISRLSSYSRYLRESALKYLGGRAVAISETELVVKRYLFSKDQLVHVSFQFVSITISIARLKRVIYQKTMDDS